VSGQQVAGWRSFYEVAWAHRAEFMRAKIRDGESDPYRIIKLLEAHERRYQFDYTNGVPKDERRTWSELFGSTPAGVPMWRGTSLLGQKLLAPFHARDCLHDFVIDYINETGPYDCILELGCGYGRGLFEIFYSGGPSNVPYFGGELTASGVSLARDLAALRPDMKASFFHFDHLKPDLSAVPRFERVLLYTMHSIEQVAEIDPSLFEVLASAGARVTGLHFEPFGWQVRDTGPVSREHRMAMQENRWNQNFAASLAEAGRRYGLTCDFEMIEAFLPSDWANPTSLAIWHSATP
jgi:SAM-dependent methyltransferase